jgi:chemotaxis protein MotB
MKRTLMTVLSVSLVLAVTGCSGAKKEKAALRVQIDELTAANQKLTQESQSYQDSLRASEAELQKQMAELQAKEMQVQEQSTAFQQMQEAMKAEVDAKTVTIQELEGKLTVSLVEAILFDSGKAVVKKDGQAALKKVAEVLRNSKDQEIVVAGHTDNVPITSKLAEKYPTNWELSAARAIAVVKLLEADGVDPKMLVAAGLGEFRPVADNATPDGRAKNRRMEIILMPQQL